MKPTKYLYPATLGFDEPTERYYVLWPDLPGCTTTGDTEEEAINNAHEAMSLHLYGMEADNDEIPSPSQIVGLRHDENEAVVLIEVWMPSFREKMETKAVNRTVTLPGWLDKEAKASGLNYSQILQDGIMQRLRISRTVEKNRMDGITV
ncbi:MAG: type II toxin-antitoxin system HicB family antitoxin [Synergistaceae bacterium]|jgi:predicted RNase H-like HicB family nuclease|nr:type II toxin-antitoxin system HicB family antitoxin [Synergistaceae bacterium]